MPLLFDSVTYNAQKEAIWKPNYTEKINMPVSDDGFCHTEMDTIQYYNSGEIKHAIIIFATYEYVKGERSSCHACAPKLSIASFSKEMEGHWQIAQFRKDFVSFGAWGKRLGHLGIEKLGEDFYCLKVQSAIDGNQGYESGVTTFYSLNWYEQFNEAFSYVYYDSNEGAIEVGKGFTEKTTMNITPTADFYQIELSIKRTGRNLNEKKKFLYSEADGHFVQTDK